MKIYLGSDHGGFKLKEEIKEWLKEWNFSFEDLGAKEYVQDDDYPDYAWPVAVKIGHEQRSLGIFIFRSRQGESILADKTTKDQAPIAWKEKKAHATATAY